MSKETKQEQHEDFDTKPSLVRIAWERNDGQEGHGDWYDMTSIFAFRVQVDNKNSCTSEYFYKIEYNTDYEI